MGKKRNKKNNKGFSSSSLLPARSHGERPDVPILIKREPHPENDCLEQMEIDPTTNPEVADLFKGITDIKNNTVRSDKQSDSDSNISTCTEPMDYSERNVGDLQPQSPIEKHVGPTSFAQLLVKQEMPEVLSDHVPLHTINITGVSQSNVNETFSNNQVENYSKNVASRTINDQLRKELIENNNSQDTNIQSVFDAIQTIQNMIGAPGHRINNIAASQLNINRTLSNDHVKNYSGNNVATPSTNDQIRKEPVNNDSQNINIQNLFGIDNMIDPIHVKAEPVEQPENATEVTTELENMNNETLPVKRRKTHKFDSKFEQIRKKLKKEPCEDDENMNETTQQEDPLVVPSSEINGISNDQVPSDNEGAEEAANEEIIDHEIAVLPVPKKNIETVILSDDEPSLISEEQDIEIVSIDNEAISVPQPTQSSISDSHSNVTEPAVELANSEQSNSAAPIKSSQTRNFSIDILRYFNVVSELDRYDCQSCLESLQKKKINNPLNNFFPIVKKEANSKDDIKKGDILFKKIITKTLSGAKRTPISQTDNSIIQNLPVQSVTEKFPATFSPSSLPVETCSTSISQNNDYNILEKFQPTIRFPVLPTSQSSMLSTNLFPTPTTNFVVNPSPNSWSTTSFTPNSEIKRSFITFDQLQDILSSLPNFKLPDTRKQAATDQHHIGNSSQITGTTAISCQVPLSNAVSQTITPSPNSAFQKMHSWPTVTTFAAAGTSYSVPTTYVPTISQVSAAASLSEETHSQVSNTTAISQLSNAVPETVTCPTITTFPDAASHSQETCDPHPAVSKPVCLPSSKIENNVQNRNTAVVQPYVSFQPVTTLPNNNLQSLPGHNASINAFKSTASYNASVNPPRSTPSYIPANPPRSTASYNTSVNPPRSTASVSFQGSRDPRSAANRVSRNEFHPRKGKRNLSLYLNIGRDNINKHFHDLILQWNPDWMRNQNKTTLWPPICESYKHVAFQYSNEMDYYNTYATLHFLHIWHNIFQSWKHNHYKVISDYKVASVETLDDGFKVTLCAELKNTEIVPKNDDILWCIHNKEEAFFHVEDVKRRSLECGLKLKMTLRTLNNNMHFNVNENVSFAILWNTHDAHLQIEALSSLENSIKNLVLKPIQHLSKIKIVAIDDTKKIREQRDDVINAVVVPHVRVVVIEIPHKYDPMLLLIHLSYNILKMFNRDFSHTLEKNEDPKSTTEKNYKVLILLKNNQLFEQLCKRLLIYKPILAVRTKQITLTSDLIERTFESRLASQNCSEEDINKQILNHHLFLTTFSALGACDKKLLLRIKDLVCIVDDANLCTELETAVPLSLNTSKLLLIGRKNLNPELPSMLLDYKYDTTLFTRLMRAKGRL